jgi:acid phosphatase type 7
MHSPSRRLFLGASVAGLASYPLMGQEPKKDALPSKVAKEEAAFQPGTLFLTWFRDPTTTMVIQWIGVRGETSDTNVYYNPVAPTNKFGFLSPLVGWKAQPALTRPYPLTDFKVFRVELTGLTPNTDYWFRIGKQSPTYRFRTMPAKANDTIHFVSGGDCGVNSATIANNIQAARQDPMFAIIGGDLGYDNGKSVETSMAFLKNYSKTMVGRDGRLIPLIACLGNHEVDGGYTKSRDKATFFFPLFEGLYPDTSYTTLDFGDYLSLVLLDSGHTSPIDGDQADWLAKTLKAREDHPNVFVVNHVPAYPSFRDPKPAAVKEGAEKKPGTGELQRQHWTPLFDKFRVPVVLEHHDHTFKRTKPLLDGLPNENGVLYLGDGSWGRLRNPQKADPMHVMAKTSEDYHLSLHRIQGEERYHLALDSTGRIMDVGRSGQRKKGMVAAGG